MRLVTLKFLLAVMALYALLVVPARAQVASTPTVPGTAPCWSFSVTPYAWLPTISASLQATGPRGASVNSNISAGIGDYISEINFATMVGAVARDGRFSILTDFLYFNASLTSNQNHLTTVNGGPGPIDIPRSTQLGTGTRLDSAVWSLGGGYTVLQGEWGNLDAVVGLRMLSVGSRTNYILSTDVLAPDKTIALSRDGTLKVDKTLFDGIGGVAGRIKLGQSKFYIPFYLDAGGGGVPFTWQVYSGIAYSPARWVDLSAGYRYLSFQNGNGKGVRDLSLGGLIIAANFRF